MYVVTGGAGFIGSNVVWGLERRGADRIVVCDRLRSDDLKWRNVAKRELYDVVAPERLFDWLGNEESNVEGIVHMGAISATTETDADLVVDTNFRLSRDLWKWCANHHVPLVYASSAATYGDGAQDFDDDWSREALSRLRPLNTYGWSKLLFDRWVAGAVARGEPAPKHWAGLRFFNVYGPNEYHKGRMKSVAAQIYPVAAAGKPATLFKSHNPDYPDGGQLRDFVHVDDCVEMVLWLLDNPKINGIFNAGSGQARSFADLAAAVYSALGREPQIEYVPTPQDIRDKYQYFTEARMERLRAAGFRHAPTRLEDGVVRYVRDFLDTDDPHR